MVRKSFLTMLGLIAAGVCATGGAQPSHDAQQSTQREENVVVRTPPLMAREHEELHEQLAAAIASGGRTGDAAREVEERLAPHFQEENRYALPPLGLLPHLVDEQVTEEMRPAIEMGRHVEQNLSRYLEEHRNIRTAVDALETAARAEGKADAMRFAAELRLHAQQEEELFYPTAVLIGRYVEQQLGSR
jgi:hypothetical protein